MIRIQIAAVTLLAAVAVQGCAFDPRHSASAPLVVEEQGSFAVGGSVVRNAGTFDASKPGPEGQTLHGDHAYVFYQVPVNPRRLPLVL